MTTSTDSPRDDSARRRPGTRAFPTALLLLAFAAEANAGRPPRQLNDPSALPEASRWTSFVQLIGARWNARLELPPDASEARSQYWQCVEDAWHLAAPSFLRGRESPCVKLLGSLPESKEAQPSAAFRERMGERLRSMGPAVTRDDFRACASAAGARRDRALLDVCGIALEARAGRVARMEDAERFSTWMGGCKTTLLADARREASGAAVGEATGVTTGRRTDAAEEEQARHCLRHLSSFYEVQRLRKVGDFWTPEEQRLLFLRSQQLAQP